ncbi:MAG TPA: glutamine amidotransferase [Steroidobacteraceae bacterium]|nr:glutamine amidotransferase [Steroidobacteraceae bacterium]
MFEFLFKYPPAAFAQGHLVLLGSWPPWILLALSVLAASGLAVLILWRARRATHTLSGWRLTTLWLLQTVLAAWVLVLLWQPALAVAELEPQQNIIAVLLDDSRSMNLVENGSRREDQAIAALRSGLLPALGARFQVRLYRFDTGVSRAQLAQLGPAAGAATHIGDSLKQLAQETSDLPIGAVVLLSDGGDSTGGVDRDAIQALRQRRIPVHTVGFGATQGAPDVEIEDVTLATRALAQSRVSALVTLKQHGFDAATTRLIVRDGGQVLADRPIRLAPGGALQAEPIVFNVGAAGAKSLQFAVAPLPSESNRANNTVVRLLDVQSEPRRILYFEGEPRWEYKFIRRAAEDDPMLQLASILRTTENKIYRQGIKDPSELADGFPTRAEDLFAFQGLIIGSVDAGYFSRAQQELIREFADRRGGGVLFLGGRQSLADGVWGGSLAADALPVVLPESQDTFHRDPATVSLTPAGEQSAICRLVDDPTANVQRWARLPYLIDYEDPGTAKPGAVVLAQMHHDGHTMPLLVTQSYGRGRTAVLATGGTWRWQMSLPLGDRTHDVFWEQLLRWLAGDTRGEVAAAVATPILLDQSHLRIAAEVRNKDYSSAADASVTARVIGPGGAPQEIALAPVANEPGRFEAQWTVPAQGLYVSEITARRGAEELGRDVVPFERVDGIAESFHTEQNRDLLERLAASTGGRYWQPGDLGELARSLPYSHSGVSAQRLAELWNMPAGFLLILALRSGEWLLRRRWGLV